MKGISRPATRLDRSDLVCVVATYCAKMFGFAKVIKNKEGKWVVKRYDKRRSKMEHSPYTVLVSGYDEQHYVDAETEEEASEIANSEYSKGAFACIAYYWNPNWDCYSPFLEKNRRMEVENET